MLARKFLHVRARGECLIVPRDDDRAHRLILLSVCERHAEIFHQRIT